MSYRGKRAVPMGWGGPSSYSSSIKSANAHLRVLHQPYNNRESVMLKWALIFALIAVVAGLLGFTGIAAGAAGIAKILFIIFLVLFVVVVLLALLGIGAVT
jgi:uncharacterized membrane protein YtjA (UPF0391 family)